MSQVYFFRPYNGRSFRSARPSVDHGILQTVLTAGGPRVRDAAISGATGRITNWAHEYTPFSDQLRPMASGVEPSKPFESVDSSVQRHTAAEGSSHTPSNLGEDGTFDCSSSAPYWIPEEIKHYFVHRHSLAGTHTRDDSSQQTDKALRAIGRERELPTDYRNDWSRWREAFCGAPRGAVVTVLAIATIIAIAIFVALAGDLRGADFGNGGGPPVAAAPGNDDIGIGAQNDFVMPASGDSSGFDEQQPEKPVDGGRERKQNNGNDDRPDEIMGDAGEDEDAGAEAGGQEALSAKDNAQPASQNVLEELEVVALSRLSALANFTCGTPAFKMCTEVSKEFYYSPSRKACVALTTDVLGVCARGPNRFSSNESCRRHCIVGEKARPECNQSAIFSECQRRDVVMTWWYHDGRRCQRWSFPRGHCPSGETVVFSTSAECSRRCSAVRKEHSICRVPATVLCADKYRRFAYFADASHTTSESMQCRQITAPGGHWCLAGSNRYRSLDACRRSCVRVRP